MVNKQDILLRYYRQGHSHRRISRDMGISRGTVKRHLEQYASFKGSDPPVLEALGSFLHLSPVYDSSSRKKRQLSEAMIRKLDTYLESDARKRGRGDHKQVMKKVDMHEGLVALGYEIGYTTVCNYVRSVEYRAQEAYFRQHYEAGVSCEFDWAEVRLEIGGEKYRLILALFSPWLQQLPLGEAVLAAGYDEFSECACSFFLGDGRGLSGGDL